MPQKEVSVLVAFDGFKREAPGMKDDGFVSYNPRTSRMPTADDIMDYFAEKPDVEAEIKRRFAKARSLLEARARP